MWGNTIVWYVWKARMGDMWITIVTSNVRESGRYVFGWGNFSPMWREMLPFVKGIKLAKKQGWDIGEIDWESGGEIEKK